MRHSRFSVRSILSACVISLLYVSAQAQDTPPYVELHQNQVNNPPIPSARITTQQPVNTASSAPQPLNAPMRSSNNAPSMAQQSMQNTTSQHIGRPAINTSSIGAVAINPTRPVQSTALGNSNALRTTANMTTRGVQASQIATPSISISNVSFVPNVIIPVSTSGADQIDVSLLDEFIGEISPHARHYPPNFDTASHKYYASEKLEQLELWLRPYAERTDASYEVLLRAAKLNGMARNLDFGSEYAMRGSNYIARAIQLRPNSQEANFIYGMMLAEGGGFNEGKKYLLKAAELGYIEAEQSLAQSELLTDRKGEALARLQRLQQSNPNNETLQEQIEIIQNGGYYIWDLDD